MRNILWGFLSEKDHIGTTLFQVVKYAIDYPSRAIMEDLGNLNILDLVQTVKSVAREKHRMEAFVRFEHTTDDIYFARVGQFMMWRVAMVFITTKVKVPHRALLPCCPANHHRPR